MKVLPGNIIKVQLRKTATQIVPQIGSKNADVYLYDDMPFESMLNEGSFASTCNTAFTSLCPTPSQESAYPLADK